jgi:hypothetical protein
MSRSSIDRAADREGSPIGRTAVVLAARRGERSIAGMTPTPPRCLIPLAAAAALAASAAAPATAATPAPARTVTAHAAGGDVVPLTYPSLVAARVDAAHGALRRAAGQLDDGRTAKGVASLAAVRRRMAGAWRAARYVLRTTPPPPAEEARARPGAHVSGDGPAGPAKAAPADTALLVLTLQHDVTAGAVDLLDGATGDAAVAATTTLAFALAQRDQAIRDIRTYAPPEPADDARAAGGGPAVATFATLMPQLADQLGDELQAIDGLRSDSPDLTPGARQVLGAAAAQITRTRALVNRVWPPVPPED